MDAAPETRIQYRYRAMRTLRRARQGGLKYRRPCRNRKDTGAFALQEPSLITGPVEARAPPFQLGKFNNF